MCTASASKCEAVAEQTAHDLDEHVASGQDQDRSEALLVPGSRARRVLAAVGVGVAHRHRQYALIQGSSACATTPQVHYKIGYYAPKG
jgi:hypothetical protein